VGQQAAAGAVWAEAAIADEKLAKARTRMDVFMMGTLMWLDGFIGHYPASAEIPRNILRDFSGDGI
jgi:hypothetical protein